MSIAEGQEDFPEKWQHIEARTDCALLRDEAADIAALEQQYGVQFGAEMVLIQQLRRVYQAGAWHEYMKAR